MPYDLLKHNYVRTACLVIVVHHLKCDNYIITPMTIYNLKHMTTIKWLLLIIIIGITGIA